MENISQTNKTNFLLFMLSIALYQGFPTYDLTFL